MHIFFFKQCNSVIKNYLIKFTYAYIPTSWLLYHFCTCCHTKIFFLSFIRILIYHNTTSSQHLLGFFPAIIIISHLNQKNQSPVLLHFIILIHQTPIPQRFDLPVPHIKALFGAPPAYDKSQAFLHIGVNHLKALVCIYHGEKP